jgi:hypothetical protein
VENGALQPSLGFKDFRRAVRLHSLTNGQFGGEKQAGLRHPPRPQLQESSSSLLRRRSIPSGGLPPRGPVTLFFPQRLGEKGILQPCGGALQPCGEGELLLPEQGAAFCPLSGRRSCRVRAGHVQVLLAPSAAPGGRPARRTPRGRVLVFWGGLGEDRSEDLPVRFGAAAVCRRGVGGFEPTVGALRLFGLNGLSSLLVWGRG